MTIDYDTGEEVFMDIQEPLISITLVRNEKITLHFRNHQSFNKARFIFLLLEIEITENSVQFQWIRNLCRRVERKEQNIKFGSRFSNNPAWFWYQSHHCWACCIRLATTGNSFDGGAVV